MRERDRNSGDTEIEIAEIQKERVRENDNRDS